jgi:hypothetical protein
MNRQKNARLTFEVGKCLIERIALMGLKAATQDLSVSIRIMRK